MCLSVLPHSAALDCFYFLLCLPSPSLSLPHSHTLHGPCSSLLASVPASSSRLSPWKLLRNTALSQLKSATRPLILQPWATVSVSAKWERKQRPWHEEKHTRRDTQTGKKQALALPRFASALLPGIFVERLMQHVSPARPHSVWVWFFSLHYEPADSCSIGHSLLCRCTRQRREEGGSVPIRPFVFACTHRGEGDAGMRLSGSRLQPAAAAK